MRKKQVSFVGNCQSNALATFYRRFVGTPADEEVVSIDDLGMEDADIRRAVADSDVVVVQERDFKRGISREELGGDKQVFSFPLIMAGFLWPFANEPHVQNVAERPISDGPYPSQMGDSFLNRLISKGVSPEEALEQYLALDIAKAAHLDRMAELYLDRQRQRDSATGFELADYIEGNFREQKLFLTAEHPDAPLFARFAAQAFAQMGVPGAVIDGATATLFRTPFPPAELPLHPGVIAHFGLRYADADTRYMFHDEGCFTFAEFVLRYMRYENNAPLRAALFLADRGATGEALEALEQALPASPGSSRGYRAKGVLLRRLGRFDEAQAAFQIAIDAAPADPDPYVELGRSLVEAGDLEAALRAAQRAIEIAPVSSEPHALMAEVLAGTGDLEGAVAAGHEAVRRTPGEGHFGRVVGIALARAGRLHEAEGFARQAMTVEPGRADPANLLAEILEEQGRRAEAIALLDRVLLAGHANDQTYSLLGNFWLREGSLDLAERTFERGVELHGDWRPDLRECLSQVRELKAGFV